MQCIRLYSKRAVSILILVFLITAIVCPVKAQKSDTKAIVEGQVFDVEGEPLYLAHVIGGKYGRSSP